MAALGTEVAPLAFVKGVNLNSVGDTPVNIPNGTQKYYVTDVLISGASDTMAGSSATVGLYTAAAAGGTAIVTAATRTGLTTSAKVSASTIASTADTFTASTLYIRNGVAHGSALTCDVYIYGKFLP